MTYVIASGRHPDAEPEAVCLWPHCERDAVDDRLPLCERHYERVGVRYFHERSIFGVNFAAMMRKEREPRTTPTDTRTGHVYFVRFGDRIKIGYSISPQDRIKQHPHHEVLAIIPGTMADEKRCHAAFAHLR